MPVLLTKIEGRGNGIKTVLPNMEDVARALNRPATCSYSSHPKAVQLMMVVQIPPNSSGASSVRKRLSRMTDLSSMVHIKLIDSVSCSTLSSTSSFSVPRVRIQRPSSSLPASRIMRTYIAIVKPAVDKTASTCVTNSSPSS